MTSIQLQELRERIGEKAKAEPQHRFWGLYTHVSKPEVLREAYRLARKNNGAPGIDGVTFREIEAGGLERWLDDIGRELRERTYRPLPCRQVTIPKDGKKVRLLKIPAIRDRVVQGALRLIIEPIFEADFQPGSYGYRPGRSAHEALERVYQGLSKTLHHVIDLDLASYFDTVRHHLLLEKLARRIRDRDVLRLCKLILKSSGERGLPQGSVIGPLWANVYLDGVDRMLERAQEKTKQGRYEVVSYTRFADDLVVLVSSHPKAAHWAPKVERRLREELAKLDLTINEEKSKVADFASGVPFDFLGYTFQRVTAKTWKSKRGSKATETARARKSEKMKMTLVRPQRKKRIQFLRELQAVLRRCRHVPIATVVREIVNPRVRGWVNYFRWGHASRELHHVAWDVERKIRRFATRQRPKRRGGRLWTKWSHAEIYGSWGLFSDYRVMRRSLAQGRGAQPAH
jgi:RNA-directed DNA polymerase